MPYDLSRRENTGALPYLESANPGLYHSGFYCSYEQTVRALDDRTFDFVAAVGAGMIGGGAHMTKLGFDVPAIRAEYEMHVTNMKIEIRKMQAQNRPLEEIARYASGERARIANVMRSRHWDLGLTRALYAARDIKTYGWGGRTWDNIYRRYDKPGMTPADIHSKIVTGAQTTNPDINNAMKGVRYLKHGGPIVMVMGAGITADRIHSASESERPRVIAEEAGGFAGGAAGGWLGGSGAVAGCLLFGGATWGWGLLACGVIGSAAGGIAGGAAGSYVGGELHDTFYYTDMRFPSDTNDFLEIPQDRLFTYPPY